MNLQFVVINPYDKVLESQDYRDGVLGTADGRSRSVLQSERRRERAASGRVSNIFSFYLKKDPISR